MNWWRLLKAMMLKELRTTLRERQTAMSLAISLIVLVIVVGGLYFRVQQHLRPLPAKAALPATTQATRPAVMPPARDSSAGGDLADIAAQVDVDVVRWACIGVGAGIGVFFGLGYVAAATLASFAGEKDDRTLEILLASPVHDTTLLVTKCLSILLPMSGVAYLFLLLPGLTAAVLFRDVLARTPVHVATYVLVLSLPVTVLIQASLVMLCAVISAKAETLKGANQAFGAVFMIIFFGIYSVPLVVRYMGWRGSAIALGRIWLTMPFAAQYLVLLAGLALVAVGLGLAARLFFRRDKLLG